MSIVNIVEDELKIDVNELISAANMTANIRPVNPTVNTKVCEHDFSTNVKYCITDSSYLSA